MECISKFLRISATDTESLYWANRLKSSYGIDYDLNPNLKSQHILLRQMYRCLSIMPEALVRDCHVSKVIFRDLGPSRPKYPNHGFYLPLDNTVTMNVQMFYNPDQPEDFFDERGYFITRVEQTLIHEFAHSFDDNNGKVSLQDSWLKLSGWSKDREQGLKRLIIKEPGTPEIVGEWWYSPDAKFFRFYGRRNPWDDFADAFSAYVGNIKDKVPESKRKYLDHLLRKYY